MRPSFIQPVSGRVAIAISACWALSSAIADDDEMYLTDEPGNWFRSETTGTPLAVIDAGDRVDFIINNCCTTTRHTVTLLVKPARTQIAQDPDQSQRGNHTREFDVPCVYVLY